MAEGCAIELASSEPAKKETKMTEESAREEDIDENQKQPSRPRSKSKQSRPPLLTRLQQVYKAPERKENKDLYDLGFINTE